MLLCSANPCYAKQGFRMLCDARQELLQHPNGNRLRIQYPP